jgi:DNA-directed RNA polymerase subunit RPC12/RpoP
MKTCSKCKKELPLDSFYKRKGTKDGLQYECKKCRASVNATYDRAAYHRKRAYGITLTEYEGMAFSQDWKCAICGSKTEKDLLVDHNHDTGQVRGLLCHTCNTGIGYLKDSTAVLRGAIEYLEENGSYGH